MVPPWLSLAVAKLDAVYGRCYLKGREGDAANAILTAVGHCPSS